VKNAKCYSLNDAKFPPRPTYFPRDSVSVTQFSRTFQDGSIMPENMPHEENAKFTALFLDVKM
jgi:hypothetical protein